MRIEVITDILSVKIVDNDDGMTDVLFNQGYLVPFKFDVTLKKFYVETVEKNALEKYKKGQDKKQVKDPKKELEEINNLPKELEEIKVYYKKDPKSRTIDLADYVLDLIVKANGR